MASASYIAGCAHKVRMAKTDLVEFRDALVGELEREGGLYPENIQSWTELNEAVQLLRIWTGHLRKELQDNLPPKPPRPQSEADTIAQVKSALDGMDPLAKKLLIKEYADAERIGIRYQD